MAKIHINCFKLDLEFKSAWFFPEYEYEEVKVKGYLGTDTIFFICLNPSLGQFSSGSSSKAVKFFYKSLKEHGFENAHLSDIIKSRLSGDQSNALWKDNRQNDSVIKKNVRWLKEEMKIIGDYSNIHVIGVGKTAYDILNNRIPNNRKYFKGIKFKSIHYLRHYSNVEKYSYDHRNSEMKKFTENLGNIRKSIRA